MTHVSEKDVQKIAVDCVREKKNPERIDVSHVEHKGDVWVVIGTCPIDLDGHLWTEKFEVTIDKRGKIASTDFSLL